MVGTADLARVQRVSFSMLEVMPLLKTGADPPEGDHHHNLQNHPWEPAMASRPRPHQFSPGLGTGLPELRQTVVQSAH